MIRVDHPRLKPQPGDREYDSARDYPLIVEECKEHGTSCIPAVASALMKAGVRWPNLNSDDDSARVIDRDVLRAWRELGLHPHTKPKLTEERA